MTRSDHPKALTVDVLRQSLPAGLSACCAQDIVEALARAGLWEESPVCIMGSLHLIGRAREALGLPCERDGFGEDLHRESLACLAEACANLDVGIEPASEDGNLVCIRPPGRGPVYFLRNRHPFNDYVAARLAEDKAYQYELFTQAGLPVPETLVAFNPFADERFSRYRTHASIDAVVEDVERRFSYPVVVKRNKGSLAQGVFLETDRRDLKKRLRSLFENSGFLDNLMLVQEYVRGPEYRIVAARDELLLAYEKVSEGPCRDLNPLHGPAGIAKPVDAPKLIEALSSLTARVSGVIELGFYAIDVIRSVRGIPGDRDQSKPDVLFLQPAQRAIGFRRHLRRIDCKVSAGIGAAGRARRRTGTDSGIGADGKRGKETQWRSPMPNSNSTATRAMPPAEGFSMTSNLQGCGANWIPLSTVFLRTGGPRTCRRSTTKTGTFAISS